MGSLGKYMKQAHGYFAFPKLEGEIGTRMKFRGKEVLVWSLNNYIGLANHPEVREADAQGAADYGMAYPMGARMMSGQTTKHEELEKNLAEFVGKQDAFLLNFGYQGMVSIIDAVCGRNDVIVYDSEAHACILDGVRLHMGKRFVYAHNNMDSLRNMLQKATRLAEKQGGGIIVITEGVFGMSGDLGKLDEVAKFKDEFSFRLLVDDAHGFGTMGATGAGTAEHFGVSDKVDLLFGTFAKSLPMPMVIGALKRLELLRTKPELREKLWFIVDALQGGLKAEGFDLGATNSCVTPVYFNGGVGEATSVVMDLRENFNVFCSVVAYPVIPKGLIMLRLIPTAMHTLEDVEYTIKAFSEVRKKLEEGKYNLNQIPEIND